MLLPMIPERLQWLVRADAPSIELAELFRSAGHEVFLVGGSLRDALLGRTPSVRCAWSRRSGR